MNIKSAELTVTAHRATVTLTLEDGSRTVHVISNGCRGLASGRLDETNTVTLVPAPEGSMDTFDLLARR